MANNESDTRSLLLDNSTLSLAAGEGFNLYGNTLALNMENTNLLQDVQLPGESTSINIELEENLIRHNENYAESLTPVTERGVDAMETGTGRQFISQNFLSFIRRNGMPNLSRTNQQDWRRNVNNWLSFSNMPNREIASTVPHNSVNNNNNNNNNEIIDWVRASMVQVNSENIPNEFQRQQELDGTNGPANAVDNDLTTASITTTTDERFHRTNNENLYSQLHQQQQQLIQQQQQQRLQQQQQLQEEEGQRQQDYDTTFDEAPQLLVKILRHLIFYLPFLGIFLLKVIHDHFMGILDVLTLQYIFYLMNNSMCNQVSKLSQKSYKILFRDLLFISCIIIYNMSKGVLDPFGLLVSTPHQQLQQQQQQQEKSDNNENNSITTSTTLATQTPFSVILYYVIINDLVLKLFTIMTKIVLTMLPTKLVRQKSKARIYVLVEYLSQFYRATCPIREWTAYLCSSSVGLDMINGIIFSCSYLTAKGFEFVKRGKSLKNAILTVLDSQRRPTERELSAADVICAICHDTFTSPIVIECGHIFCEDCVNTWLKREHTCPMCRAKVRVDTTYQDGSTSSFYQIF